MGGVALVSALFAPLVFLGHFYIAMLGMVLWGIGMGAQESIMRAAVAEKVSAARRGTAYGVFNSGYGLLWFAGSALMGVLYDVSVLALYVTWHTLSNRADKRSHFPKRLPSGPHLVWFDLTLRLLAPTLTHAAQASADPLDAAGADQEQSSDLISRVVGRPVLDIFPPLALRIPPRGFIALSCPLTVSKEISNIGMGFLH